MAGVRVGKGTPGSPRGLSFPNQRSLPVRKDLAPNLLPTRSRHPGPVTPAALRTPAWPIPVPAVRKPSPGFGLGASRRLCCGPAGPRAGSLHRGRAPPSAPSPPALRAQERRGRPRSRAPAGALSPRPRPHPTARGRPGSFFRLLLLRPPSFRKTARPGGGRAISRLGGPDSPPLPRTRRAG